MKNQVFAALAGLTLLVSAHASQEPTLKVGDPAPKLIVEEWVKGSPVESFQPGSVYIVEFWATWCGPCIASMPHLSKLQQEFKDKKLTIIGMTSEDSSNSIEAVRKMVDAKGDGMGYTVAWDVERQTNEAWMKASGQNGIPTSFLVDQTGKIAWIGHPASLDVPLASVVAGTWDYVKGPELMKRAAEAQRAIYEAMSVDPEKALELLTKFKADYPLSAKDTDDLHFAILTQLPEHQAHAVRIGNKIIDKAIAAKNAPTLNQFAWTLVDPASERENRFLDLALRAANAANELTNQEEAPILDTVARVHFWRGDLEQALKIQRSAVEHAKGAMKADLEKAVREYEEALEEQKHS